MSKSRLSWDDVDYCLPYDDGPDYGEGRAPLPFLSKDAYDWLSFANRWVLQYFKSIRRDILDDLISTLPYLSMHIVAGYVLKGVLTPFCAVSERQIIDDRGLSPFAERRVRHVLRVYELRCVNDNATYYARVTRAAINAGAKPLIRRIRTGDGARVSTYELLNIRPIDRHKLLYIDPEVPGVEGGGAAVDEDDKAVEVKLSDVESAAANSAPDVNFSTAIAVPCVEIGRDGGHPIRPDAAIDDRGAGVELDSGNSGPSSSSLEHHPSLEAETGRSLTEKDVEAIYAKLIEAFGKSPGTKDRETRDAFERLLARGYEPETIIDAARRYRMSSDPNKWRFPLRALEDPDWVRAYCGAPPKRVDPSWSLSTAAIGLAALRDRAGIVYGVLLKGPAGDTVDTGLTVAPGTSLEDIRKILRDQKDEIGRRLGL